MEHRGGNSRILTHHHTGRQAVGNYRRSHHWRGASARANDGFDEVRGWPSSFAG